MNKTAKYLLIAFITYIILSVIAIILVFILGVFIGKSASQSPEIIDDEIFVDIGSFDEPQEDYDEAFYTNYRDYLDEIGNVKIKKSDFKEYNVLIFEIPYDTCAEVDIEPTDYYIRETEIWINVDFTRKCNYCNREYKYYALKLPKDISFEIVNIDYNQRNKIRCSEEMYAVDKPMIYIYPEEDMEVEVKLGNSKYLTTSYPKYEDSWKVYAHKNGNLEYEGRTYYGLYWEGIKQKKEKLDEGFVIKGEDTTKFLEEKLEILGLNEREINEFIIYWLPKMENNKYNYIRFETKEEIEEYMPLEITPKPDTVIRVYMEFKGLDEEIKVKEQKLEPIERKGYTVVEWGGSLNE